MAPTRAAATITNPSHPLRRRALCTALALLAAAPAALAQRRGRRADLDQAEALIHDGANRFRVAEGREPLEPNEPLAAAAAAFADFMARTDQYGHEADGRQPAQRAQAHGYQFCRVAENIAFQFSSRGYGTEELGEGFVKGWIRSPGHRRNLLDRDATETGIAVARSPRSGRYYAVQLFGRPASLRIRFEVSNRSPHALRYEVGGRHYALDRGVTRTHEQCTRETIRLALPGHDAPTALQPRDGARFRVEGAGAALRVVAG